MVASKEDYKKALLKLRDKGRFRNTKYLDFLRAQYASEHHTITSTEMARIVGYPNYNAANLQYGTLGRELANIMNYTPPERKNGEHKWFWVLATGNELQAHPEGHYEFVMRLELVDALEEMNWVRR